ncbi:MAG TPA: STAS domain-containing protein [Streptomyces sp.]
MTPRVLVITGRVTPADVPGLCARIEALLYDAVRAGAPAAPVECDVGGVVRPGLALVEALARLALAASRAGAGELRLRNAPAGLRDLLDLVGLADAITPPRPRPGGPGSRTAGTSAGCPGSSAAR